VTDQPLLGLVMIVRQEAHGIRETLASFRLVDHWTILDTGSTDGTQDIIHEALIGVPGTLYEEPFIDFATSRNRALDLHGKTTTFVIMPDSDDRLVHGPELREFLGKAASTEPAFLVNLRRGDLSYYLPIVLSTEAGWRYHGAIHEYVGPVTGDGFATIKIPSVQVKQDTPPQSAEASRKRWERDLTLLHAELVTKPDDPRTLFYLGQTYECIGKPDLALVMYRSRIRVGGWAEETFETYLRCAKILQAMQRPWSEIQQAYLDAFKFDPKRAEPLFKIAEHWYCEQSHHLAYLFASRAAELPCPAATLFIDDEIYTWRAADIVAISSYYLDDAAAKRVGGKCAEQCVRVHPNDERMRANRSFYTPSAAELFEGYTSKPIAFTIDKPWVPYNPSIYLDQTRTQWRCIVRTSNYEIINGQYITPDNNIIHTRNFMLDLDDKLDVVKTTEMIDKTGIPRSSYPVHGFEDCRLFEHEGQLVFTSTVCDFDLERWDSGPREIVLGELDADYAIVAATPLRGPWSPIAQKNWIPTGDGHLIYSIAPDGGKKSTVFDLSGREISCGTATQFNSGRLRGGSQAVRVPGGWLCIVHDVAWPSSRVYLHRFVLLSTDFEIISMTELFHFMHKGIEFCSGLAFDGKQLVASFGVDDHLAIFGIFDFDVVRSKLRTDYQI
jgi:hypothetical protein